MTHGLNGYSNRGCRCAVCREAGRQYYARRYVQNIPPPRLVVDGKLCCLICREPYEDHPLSKSCYREAAKL